MSETTPSDTVAELGNATVSFEPEDDQQEEQQSLPLAPAAHAALPATGDEELTVEPVVAVEESEPVATVTEVDEVDDSAATHAVTPEDYYFGPVGKRRKPVVVLLLCVVTFGLYGLVWHARNNRELGDFDPQMHIHARRSTWAVTIPWLAGLLVTLAGAARIGLSSAGVSLPFDPQFSVHNAYFLLAGLLAVPYVTLLLPFSYAAVVMTAERIRIVEERVGLTTDVQIRPASVGALLLLPIVGPIMLIAFEQRRINAAWERVDPQPRRTHS